MPTEVIKRKKPSIITLDTIAPKEMTWLWHPYIPSGTVTAVFGQGGMGKSYMTCDIAARLSNGTPLPGSDGPTIPQKVLMLSAEDDYATVLVPRLLRMGTNLANIAVPSFQFTLDPWGAEQVAELMREFAATVVFIDPIVYYAGGKMDMNKSNEVRAMMEKLKGAAEASNSSVIIVGHIRKSEEGNDANRMMGSADWVNAARSGVLVTKTNDGMPVMRHVKTNYGKKGLSRGFEITDEGFIWGDVFDEDATPVAGDGPNNRGRKDAAVSFLRVVLAHGPVPAEELIALAAEENIAPATLNRAKIGVAESVYSKTSGWVWKLLDKPGNSRPTVDDLPRE
jgi:hypothetical protein